MSLMTLIYLIFPQKCKNIYIVFSSIFSNTKLRKLIASALPLKMLKANKTYGNTSISDCSDCNKNEWESVIFISFSDSDSLFIGCCSYLLTEEYLADIHYSSFCLWSFFGPSPHSL